MDLVVALTADAVVDFLSNFLDFNFLALLLFLATNFPILNFFLPPPPPLSNFLNFFLGFLQFLLLLLFCCLGFCCDKFVSVADFAIEFDDDDDDDEVYDFFLYI